MLASVLYALEEQNARHDGSWAFWRHQTRCDNLQTQSGLTRRRVDIHRSGICPASLLELAVCGLPSSLPTPLCRLKTDFSRDLIPRNVPPTQFTGQLQRA